MKAATLITCILFCMTAQAQEPLLLNDSVQDKASDHRFNLHAKVSVTPRCDLMIMSNLPGAYFWFVELVTPKQRTAKDLTIDELLKTQDTTKGTFMHMNELVDQLSQFKNIETGEDGLAEHFDVNYTDTRNQDASKSVSISTIYQRYTNDSTTLDVKDQTRRCLEED